MHSNWAAGQQASTRKPSAKNWRWEKKLYISQNNQSPEKRCEKAIAEHCGEDWVNQVPTASGLLNGVNEKHCNIDLVHRIAPTEFEFIELKYEDGTPLSAGFEILKYGLLYVFSRRYAAMLGYSEPRNSILGASVVHLRVVAPAAYYLRFRMDWLQNEANLGLGSLRLDGYEMDFRFESMSWPTEEKLASAVAARTTVYQLGHV